MLIAPQPWLAWWNHDLLEKLFVALPHGARIDTLAQALTFNALISTWIYAFAFYLFWQKEDERRTWRRLRLMEIALASVATVGATLLVRQWVGWPAPARAESFHDLYPKYLWGSGSTNSFPSHSTLVYFLVALGLWPIDRRWSTILAVLVLPVISLPRIYLGGHYPIDVAAAMLLAAAGLWLVRRLTAFSAFSYCMRKAVQLGWLTEAAFFLWLLELGEGFRGSAALLRLAMEVARRVH